MRTPAGTECNFYYEDFHRGRNVQECRVPKSTQSAIWKPEHCAKCPIPAILRANASPHLHLELTIKQTMLGFGRKMQVKAWCNRHDVRIEDPYIGCPECNNERPGLNLFAEALDDD
ncbi:MAG: hypothetical protein H6673_02890 [Anaerolineales bacterium]|nr:hypothetical protein [Anaerolineales bacterium]